jgi:ADP-heptose:LPS heptosyltransferase
VLLVPGGAAHRPDKRWPAASYGRLARLLEGRGLTPVILGTAAERPLAQVIVASGAAARDLTADTSLAEVAELGRGAAGAVGNDTGPMHVIAAVGCPSVVLFSGVSDPALCAPRGPKVETLRPPALADIGPEDVMAALARLGRGARA